MNIKGVLWCIKTIYTCMFNNNCRPIDVKCKKKNICNSRTATCKIFVKENA